MKKLKVFPPLIALSIVFEALQGIDHLHLHDTIHSDLSSANVMIAKSGKVLVTDFGLSCYTDVEDYKKYMVGTPGYYSPEHISESSIIPESDLYCVGLILYEMLFGVKAITSTKSRSDILADMKSIDFSMSCSSNKKLNNKIIELLTKALRIQAGRRYKSAEAMLFDVYQILKKCEITSARSAISLFLFDQKLSSPIPKEKHQEIYYGYED